MTKPDTPTPRSTATPHRSQGFKTLATWAVLVAMFAVIYFNISPKNSSSPQTNWTPFLELSGALFGVLLVIFVMVVRRNLRELRTFHTDTIAALAESSRGNHEAARATFWRWVEHAHVSRIVAVARHNLAWTLMRMGNLDQAIEVAQQNDAGSRTSLERVALAPMSAVDIALYHALAGHLVDATTWLEQAASRRDDMSMPIAPAIRALATAIVDCRAGRAQQAANNLEDHWSEHEAVLTGDLVRVLRIVRSFARHADGPRHAGAASIDLSSLRPAHPGEYAMLSASWPEMAAFLAANDLA